MCKTNSWFFLNGVCFIHPKLSLFFPTLPPFFFMEAEFLIKYPLYSCDVSSSFSFKFRSGDYHEDAKEATSSSFFRSHFLPRWTYFKLRYWSYFFLTLNALLCWNSLSSLSCLFNSQYLFSGVFKISQKIRVFILNPFKLFRGYYLIQAI